MHPEDALTTLAQLGVAVAGFSGIVLVLGARARDGGAFENTLRDVLLFGGFGVLLWALVPLIMLSAQLPEHTVWIVASGGWSAQQILFLIMRAYQARRTLSPRARPNTVFFVSIFVGGVSILALQIVNVVWLASAWPHLTALAWWLMLSFVVLLRLMRASRGDG